MSLKGRLDALSREHSFGEMWDGCTLEEISRLGFFSDEGPTGFVRPGVQRAVLALTLSWLPHDIAEADEETAAELRAEFGIAADATDADIRARCHELAVEAGLTLPEMRKFGLG
jgi:hypothetical protein